MTDFQRLLRDSDFWLGCTIASASTLGLALWFAEPILYVGSPGSWNGTYWHELVPAQLPYEWVMLLACPLGLSFLLLTSGGLIVGRVLRPQRLVPWQYFLLSGVVAGGASALSATRWIGVYVARLLDTGRTAIHLGHGPWYALGIGLVALVVAILRSWPHNRKDDKALERRGLAISLFGLLGSPLLPWAVVTVAPGVQFNFDELTIDLLRHTTASTVAPWAALISRAALVLAVAVNLGGHVLRRSATTRWRYLLHAAIITTGGAATVLFYATVADLGPGTTAGPNLFPALTWMGLLANLVATAVKTH